MPETALCVIGWAAFGLLIAFINSRISKAGMNTKSPSFAIAVNFIRIFLDAAALATAFFVCKHTGLPLAPSLIAVAIALTVGGGIILVGTVRKIREELPTEEEEARKKAAEETSQETDEIR